MTVKINRSAMKKPVFNQLRGTPAQKIRHRFAVGVTAVTLVVSLALGAILNKFVPEPGKRTRDFILNSDIIKRKHEWRPLASTMYVEKNKDGEGGDGPF
ncbi:hypothetical protein JTE90_022348 [Oedothorax gibbosus]|uniref:Uncharacterized protein n=1 Tax=Oedothorax gibbosus TaxID=931172 RepID=A0AAV6VX01_9ARAC|nr:hypothetical protein JTE90_022348 [Oedothorax gibbosus]